MGRCWYDGNLWRQKYTIEPLHVVLCDPRMRVCSLLFWDFSQVLRSMRISRCPRRDRAAYRNLKPPILALDARSDGLGGGQHARGDEADDARPVMCRVGQLIHLRRFQSSRSACDRAGQRAGERMGRRLDGMGEERPPIRRAQNALLRRRPRVRLGNPSTQRKCETGWPTSISGRRQSSVAAWASGRAVALVMPMIRPAGLIAMAPSGATSRNSRGKARQGKAKRSTIAGRSGP